MKIFITVLLAVCLVIANVSGEYRGGFGPRPADRIPLNVGVLNGQQSIYAAPNPATIYRPPTDGRPLPSKPLAERVFGVRPSTDPGEPFNPSPNLFLQATPGPRLFAQQNQNFYGQQPQVATVTRDLKIYPNPVQQPVISAIGPIQRPQTSFTGTQNAIQVDIPSALQKSTREIDRFDTSINRFASEAEIKNRQRIVLPMELGNAPLETFLRRAEPEPPNGRVVSVGTQPIEANTRLLIADPNKLQETTRKPISSFDQEQRPQVTTPLYAPYRADRAPKLANIAHDDKRPATGGRVGPQARFGGGTNEFREDLGILTYGLNNQHEAWKHLPSRFGNEPITTSTNPRLGENPASNLDNRGLAEVVTSTSRKPNTNNVGREPLYPEFGTRYGGTVGTGPVNKFIDGGFSPPDRQGARIDLEKSDQNANDEMWEGALRPYRGPEEITRSRYQNAVPSDNKNRHFKLDLLNE